jgi:hypothetical protein
MTALADLSDVVHRLTGGSSGTPENIWFHKDGRHDGAAVAAVPIAGRPYSLWRHDGHPGPGAAPAGWANPDNTTAGGLEQTDPGGGREKWLMHFSATGIAAGSLLLYDRLGHNGNLDGTATAAQSFTGSITRYTSGVGNIMWYEIYGNTTTILGASSTTMTVQYDAPEGNNQTSPAVVIGNTGFREGNQARFIPLVSGHTGVIAVDNVDLVATTGTVGAFGITIAHPLAIAPINAGGILGWRDFITGLPGIPEIETDACLALLWLPSAVTVPEVFGCASMVEA